MAQQRRDHDLGRIDGNGEAEPLAAHDDRGVEPDDTAVRVDQRTSRVAWIQRGVGLNDVRDQSTRPRAEGSTQRADDAGGHRVLKAVGISERDDDLTGPQAIGITKLGGNDVRRVDLEDGQVRLRIVPDEARGGDSPVR